MKAFLIVLSVAFVPCLIEGTIEWIAASFLIGWFALAVVVVIFACVLFARRVRNDDGYYQTKEKNTKS